MSTRSRLQPWFRDRVTMKDLVAKLDAASYEDWEMRQIFMGPFFMKTELPIVVMPAITVHGTFSWPKPMRDRRGRFTKPGKPEW